MNDNELIWLEKDMFMVNLSKFSTFSIDHIVILPDAYEESVIHYECDEWLYILDGELIININGKTLYAKKGDCFDVPRGTTHGSKNFSTSCVHLLSVCSPPFQLEYMHHS